MVYKIPRFARDDNREGGPSQCKEGTLYKAAMVFFR